MRIVKRLWRENREKSSNEIKSKVEMKSASKMWLPFNLFFSHRSFLSSLISDFISSYICSSDRRCLCLYFAHSELLFVSYEFKEMKNWNVVKKNFEKIWKRMENENNRLNSKFRGSDEERYFLIDVPFKTSWFLLKLENFLLLFHFLKI